MSDQASPAQPESLYDRIGGKAAIDAAVDIFYTKVLADERINHWFSDTDMARQHGKQKVFLAYAFGGPVKYDGKDMRAGHAHLVEKGLGDGDFNAVGENLLATLKELNVPQDMIDEVMTLVESTRNDVLGR